MDNASTRSTGEHPCCNRELTLSLSLSLSLSPRFSRSPPLFLFRFRNYSGVIAFRPPQYWLTRTRAKKKIPTVRVTHTHTRARARDHTKQEGERQRFRGSDSSCRSMQRCNGQAFASFPSLRPPSIQFNATQSVNVTRMQPHTGVPRFAMKQPLFRPVLRC